ncbi:hypothetical protein [Roseateles depolymerans]|uniref:Uncharacterized protein n=1 Tax=Roseateles depolymerans TaxID=76731 RepID=A0A0U3N6A0_9BURK|nr:hypothetical protein [Roseateles depolymerans]ALV07723.1 hypothetical protein RD2015_3265 [Roseateles depolymerans]REG22053.1 hypothetical protein DES44_1195 [Roseateles depolymerans]
MTTPSLDDFVCVPIPLDLYAELARRQPRGVATLLADVAWDFVDRTAEDVDALPRAKAGVQWDALFLPDGTEVRTKYFGEWKVATVAGGRIVWEGETYSSMSQLARAMRGDTSNNAWKVLEVKRPNDTGWKSADFLRQ